MSPRAAVRHYARAWRSVLEASVNSFEMTGDRNAYIPAGVIDASNAAYAAIPAWLRWLAAPVERRVARQADFRRRTGQS